MTMQADERPRRWKKEAKPLGRPRGQSKYLTAVMQIGRPASAEEIFETLYGIGLDPPSITAGRMGLRWLIDTGQLERHGVLYGLPEHFKGGKHVD